AGDVVEVLRGRERIGAERQEDAGEDDSHQHPEGLAGKLSCKPALLLLSDSLVKCNCHCRPSFFLPLTCRADHNCSIAPVIRPVLSSGELSEICLSAPFLPRRITMTRSATLKTSGMR